MHAHLLLAVSNAVDKLFPASLSDVEVCCSEFVVMALVLSDDVDDADVTC